MRTLIRKKADGKWDETLPLPWCPFFSLAFKQHAECACMACAMFVVEESEKTTDGGREYTGHCGLIRGK